MTVGRWLAGLLPAFWTGVVHAQGTGSYGGAKGLVQLILVGMLAVAAFVLLLVGQIFGKKAALGLLACLAAAWIGLGIHARVVESRIHQGFRQMDYEFAKGCSETTRSIARQARGDERIYFRVHGAEHVPEDERQTLPFSLEQATDGVQFVTDVPAGATNAVVVDVRYSDYPIAPSVVNAGHRLRYDLTAMTFPEGQALAQMTDMAARTGLCLGNVEPFLRKVLNRASVLRGAPESSHGLGLPDVDVHAVETRAVLGKFAISSRPSASHAWEDVGEELAAKGCRLQKESYSDPVALCADSSGRSVNIQLLNILGVHKLPDSFLLVYSVSKGVPGPTSLRIEQRRADWHVARTWGVDIIPLAGEVHLLESLGDISVTGETMTASVFEDWRSDLHDVHWFSRKLALTIPLPGVASKP